MPMEVPYEGVQDAETGDFLSGKPDQSLGTDPILAQCVDGVWTPVDENADPNHGDYRMVVVASKRASTRESK